LRISSHKFGGFAVVRYLAVSPNPFEFLYFSLSYGTEEVPGHSLPGRNPSPLSGYHSCIALEVYEFHM
jgi:hypothetical protein